VLVFGKNWSIIHTTLDMNETQKFREITKRFLRTCNDSLSLLDSEVIGIFSFWNIYNETELKRCNNLNILCEDSEQAAVFTNSNCKIWFYDCSWYECSWSLWSNFWIQTEYGLSFYRERLLSCYNTTCRRKHFLTLTSFRTVRSECPDEVDSTFFSFFHVTTRNSNEL
jgi:hypothetical protein